MSEVETIDSVQSLLTALDELHTAISKSSTDTKSLAQLVGLPGPGLDCIDLTRYIHELYCLVQSYGKDIDWADEAYSEAGEFLASFAKKIVFLRKQAVPNLWNGNGGQASAAILMTLLTMHQLIAQLLKWPTARNEYAMPPKLARRIKAAEHRLQEIESTSEGIDSKLATILRAHDAAETFPTDLDELTRIRTQIQAAEQTCTEIKVRLEEQQEKFIKRMNLLGEKVEEANAIVAKCNDAYRIATTTGLAGAFQQRAARLNWSIVGWTVGLLAALVIGAAIGSDRIRTLSIFVAQDASTSSIVLQMMLSFLSVGAPLWFAWLATSQIGQRFRLAEDYAFKASVAKAYEGYREEANMFDMPEFSTRLFSAALDRLEEPPIRLLEKAGLYSSPLHELVNSKAFQKALETMPAIRAKLEDLMSSTRTKPVSDQPKGEASKPGLQ